MTEARSATVLDRYINPLAIHEAKLYCLPQEWFDDAVSNANEGGLTQRLNEKLHRLFVGLILAYVVIGSFRPVMDNVDLGWHVAPGRWMVAHAAIYRQDAINYATLNQPVVDEYPLFQVVLC